MNDKTVMHSPLKKTLLKRKTEESSSSRFYSDIECRTEKQACLSTNCVPNKIYYCKTENDDTSESSDSVHDQESVFFGNTETDYCEIDNKLIIDEEYQPTDISNILIDSNTNVKTPPEMSNTISHDASYSKTSNNLNEDIKLIDYELMEKEYPFTHEEDSMIRSLFKKYYTYEVLADDTGMVKMKGKDIVVKRLAYKMKQVGYMVPIHFLTMHLFMAQIVYNVKIIQKKYERFFLSLETTDTVNVVNLNALFNTPEDLSIEKKFHPSQTLENFQVYPGPSTSTVNDLTQLQNQEILRAFMIARQKEKRFFANPENVTLRNILFRNMVLNIARRHIYASKTLESFSRVNPSASTSAIRNAIQRKSEVSQVPIKMSNNVAFPGKQSTRYQNFTTFVESNHKKIEEDTELDEPINMTKNVTFSDMQSTSRYKNIPTPVESIGSNIEEDE